MQRPDVELGARGYEPAHIKAVLAELESNFSRYFASSWTKPDAIKAALATSRAEWDSGYKSYVELLDIEFLDEFEDDPNAFKKTLRGSCPIIRKSLNANTDEMKEYKIKFQEATGRNLLEVTRNLAEFAHEYMETFDEEWLAGVTKVDELELGDLQTEDYTAYGVIGGGIKSQFLYSLYPQTFPNRSQSAIWALYFLTDKKDFGFIDGSEFLMMHTDSSGAIIQQNYHYPYDLFTFYALHLYRWLEAACKAQGLTLDGDFKFVHLDAFLNNVAEKHRSEIRLLKGSGEYDYAG